MRFLKIILFLILIFLLGFIKCKDQSSLILKEPVLDMEFVKIKKGSFLMGDYENLKDSEIIHKVKITYDYWLGKTEVTQNQWQRIMGNKELHPHKPSPFRNLNPDYPKVSVSYFDIEVFLEKLNNLSTDYQFRLPTEAEWEYACKAGTQTPFSFGVFIYDSLANYNSEIPSKYTTLGSYLGSPAPVGSYPPNQWGLYDMHGNVWEWVSDWFAPYTSKSVTNPTGPKDGIEKVIRGGSWYFGAENAKSSFRRTHEPNSWGFSIGFRIICEKKN
ncbi:MAG: formylglycine-generating enzyme family protein [Saprospiraceae bacterium]|nr:formylglycine-generating enzyme family protein [Maribacter sp.]NNE15289.1 formylglycine-generating enzyme family protein [Saprospiraceae bacterium]